MDDADFYADFGCFSRPHMIQELAFGIAMNRRRIFNRKAYRKLWEDVLLLSSLGVPYEVFYAGISGTRKAEDAANRFNASVFED